MKHSVKLILPILFFALLSLYLTTTAPVGAATTPAFSRALAYLESAQRPTGGWGEAISARDTAAVVAALRLLRPGSAALPPAEAWLRDHPTPTVADQARITAALAGHADVAALAAQLLMSQNTAAGAPRGAAPIYEDPLTAAQTAWLPGPLVTCQTSYTNGSYRIHAGTYPNLLAACWQHANLAFTDIDIQVQARQIDTTHSRSYGLIFRSTPGSSIYGTDNTFYTFEVNPTSEQFYLGRQAGATRTILINWTNSAAIKRGTATNLLRIAAHGAQIRLYANGQLLASKTDATYSAGKFGPIVTNLDNFAGGADGYFNNLAVYRNRDFSVAQPNGADGGWGVAPGYASDNLNTALALAALRAAGVASSTMTRAINYLIAAQNGDGGWGIARGAGSTPALTAQVMLALSEYTGSSGVVAALDKGARYLVTHQNADGGWGIGGSAVAESALVYRALRGRNPPANAQSYLLNHQAADGSWNHQPYDTALVILALGSIEVYLPLVRR